MPNTMGYNVGLYGVIKYFASKWLKTLKKKLAQGLKKKSAWSKIYKSVEKHHVHKVPTGDQLPPHYLVSVRPRSSYLYLLTN